MDTNTDPVRAQAWAKLEREWAIDGMPADKIRLARAAFDAGAALASAPPSATLEADDEVRLSAKTLLVSACLAGRHSFTADAIEDGGEPAIPFEVAVSALAAALAQQPAAPSGTRNFREILAEREAQSPGITAKIEERTAELVAALQQPAAVGMTKRELFTIAAMHTMHAGDYAKWEHLAQDAVSLADATLAVLAAEQQG